MRDTITDSFEIESLKRMIDGMSEFVGDIIVKGMVDKNESISISIRKKLYTLMIDTSKNESNKLKEIRDMIVSNCSGLLTNSIKLSSFLSNGYCILRQVDRDFIDYVVGKVYRNIDYAIKNNISNHKNVMAAIESTIPIISKLGLIVGCSNDTLIYWHNNRYCSICNHMAKESPFKKESIPTIPGLLNKSCNGTLIFIKASGDIAKQYKSTYDRRYYQNALFNNHCSTIH